MQLFYQPEITQSKYLDAEESGHCIRVLRKKTGDIIHITDGAGGLFKGKISNLNKRKVEFEVLESEQRTPQSFHLDLAIAPTKSMDRMEWFVEKCVELGIDHIYFFKCHHSERHQVNLERLNKKAISAMKQSIKTFLPTLHPMKSFNDIISIPIEQKFIAHVGQLNQNLLLSSVKPKANVRVFIGPEGDFSPSEIELAINNGYQKISLGNNRLRTETAGIAACHILNLVNSQ